MVFFQEYTMIYIIYYGILAGTMVSVVNLCIGYQTQYNLQRNDKGSVSPKKM